MRKDLIQLKPIYSSFFSCPQDTEKILRTLFVTSRPYSDMLKRLLIINNPDCLDKTNEEYQKIIDSYSLSDLIEAGYVKLDPKIKRGVHEEIKTYILMTFDNFTPTKNNPLYLDYYIHFDVVGYTDAWTLKDYKNRLLTICGYIDGILNSLTEKNKVGLKNHQPQIKLSGIGSYELLGCQETVLNEELGLYTLTYQGTHLSNDKQEIGKIDNG